MENEFKKRISEVLYILEHSEKDIVDKIPPKFMELMKKNKADGYNININYEDEKCVDKLPNDTKGLLALIYRDYIADKNERETLILLEKQEEIERRKKQEEKYDAKNIFKQNQKPTNERLQEEAIQEVQNALMVIKEEKWYERIVNKIKEFFGIRHK